MNQNKNISIKLALIPIVYLISLLSFNIIYLGEDALGGMSQIILLSATVLCYIVAYLKNRINWKIVENGIIEHLGEATPAILILFMIGALSGTWMLSGVVPTIIYYGLKLVHPELFLFSTALLCAIVSVASGSSWTTVATIGVAMMGIGKILGYGEGWIAGAVISGAYFGDKISPLSDTTNLAASSTGTPLFTHIRNMLYTTIPSLAVALLVFFIAGFTVQTKPYINIDAVSTALSSTYTISGWLLLIPVITFAMIIKRIPPFVVLFVSVALSAIIAYWLQNDLCSQIVSDISASPNAALSGVFRSIYGSVSINTGDESLNQLLSTGGMQGMLNTVWLIVAAMAFGGALEATGMLRAISNEVIRFMTQRFSTVFSTAASCVFLNIATGDQYISILLPGKMYRSAYAKRNYPSKLLSRTLEDSATVTSVLIPWNTCGMTQATILQVPTMVYFPYCIFNLVSPIATLIAAYLQRRKYKD